MPFNSFLYICLFLPTVVALYFYLGRDTSNRRATYCLLGASLLFYAYWNFYHVPIIVGSVLMNFLIGSAIVDARIKGSARRANLLLATGVCANVSLLVYFKYTNFLVANWNDISGSLFGPIDIVLPLAISFFTFQQIAYLADSWKGLHKGGRFLDYAVFVTFFPQLIAGPIVHYAEMMPQFKDRSRWALNWDNLYRGAVLFSIGLFKKVCIADTFALFADHGYSSIDTIGAGEAWVATLSYTLQLYFDFSGYTDMALGAALMFNIRLPLNFNSPYKAHSIRDFWLRWHITLSRFLRDYIYIPLGGNRRGESRTMLNVMLVFLVGGLWHGANWTFVLWGLLHGTAFVIRHLWAATGIKLAPVVAIGITFLAVHLGWVFFRSPDIASAFAMLRAMSGFGLDIIEPTSAVGLPGAAILSPLSILMVAFGLAAVWFLPNSNRIVGLLPAEPEVDAFRRAFSPMLWGTLAGMAMVVLAVQDTRVFLYFQF